MRLESFLYNENHAIVRGSKEAIADEKKSNKQAGAECSYVKGSLV